ncbi:hypothetical protein EV183_002958 [Coemansia sp. RSA 2336]|nr:hypothetical protein EV183_002958 [Coemansia sp. RSA 2336]
MPSYDQESLLSIESRFSIDSADSRVGLLSKEPVVLRRASAGDVEAACRQADLEHIMAHQARASHSPSMTAQRVVLTNAKQRDMQMASLASTVNRMGRLRFANQDCPLGRDRRASDIEGFINRLDSLGVKSLKDTQRFSPQPLVAP